MHKAVGTVTDAAHQKGSLRIIALKQSVRASAKIPDAQHKRGIPNNILNPLLYCTRRALIVLLVQLVKNIVHRLHVSKV